MDALRRDLRYALRSARSRPAFTAVAVLTLGLGIGAAAAIFSVVEGVLLRPLPYPEPDRVLKLWQVGEDGGRMTWSHPNFRDVRERSRRLQSTAEYGGMLATVTGAGEAAEVPGAVVSEEFFTVLGVRPERGRVFLPEEHRDAAPVVVLGHDYWRRELGGDPGAVGRTLVLDGEPHTVVGVMPPRLDYPLSAELWMPAEVRNEASRTAHNWHAIGRLRDGATLEQARAELSNIARRLAERHGDDTWMADATAVRLHEQMVGDVKPALLVLLGAAGLLLLISCANVANLLLARVAERRRELAVRVALGAGRRRLLGQLLTESLVLALAGGLLGVVLAVWGVDLLLAFEPGRLPRLDGVGVNPAVLGFALGVSVLAAAAVGLAAALRATAADGRESLAGGQRSQSGGLARRGARGALVASQVALTLVLLIGAGLLARSFLRLMTLDPGYRTEGALVMDVSLPGASGGGASERPPFLLGTPNRRAGALLEELLARLRAVPGIETVGGVNAFPLGYGGGNGTFVVLERSDPPPGLEELRRLMKVPERTGHAGYRLATEDYFRALDIPLLRGRLFGPRDGPAAPHAAVISRSVAEERWPGERALGRVIEFGNMDGDLRPFTVVGVVGDVRDRSLEAEPEPRIYGNAAQRTTALGGRFSLVLRGPADRGTMVASARRIARDLDPDMPVRFRTLEEVFSASLAERRFSLLLLAVFAVTALVLAAMGIYGVISHLVARSTREIGVRIALGAAPVRVLRHVVGKGVGLALIGVGVGLVAALAATRVLSSQLYGVGRSDPLTFGSVALLLAAVAFIASWVPARRATRVDPMSALRAE